ncbi:MAG TPA: hypothetical protein VKX40_02150 [Aequorivita sp.]|nr:hypothetical protein [Aequorivita sp.]
MVKAANEFGENDTAKDFTTLPQRKLQLKEYIYPNGKISKIEYNEDSQVSLKYFPDYPDLNTKYTYIDGNISTDIYNHSIEGSRAIYTYNADQRLTHLKTVEFGSHYSIRFLYDFESNTNYVYTHETSVDYDLITYNYSVNLILNDEGNIVKYEKLDLDSSQLDTATFEYTNGNMTYIKSRTNASWEITYDDNMSFHTYASGFPRIDFRNGAKYDVAGLLYHKDLHFETLDFPQFYRFLNKNNPLEYKVNGEVITTFEYEYNEDNYPISIKANFKDGTTTGVIKLNYEES